MCSRPPIHIPGNCPLTVDGPSLIDVMDDLMTATCGCRLGPTTHSLLSVDDPEVMGVWECQTCGATVGLLEGLDATVIESLKRSAATLREAIKPGDK
jgi:hypothetical protein